MSPAASDLSALLGEAASGNQDALRQLNDSVYGELHQLAKRAMAAERRDHTLQPSGLVHEAFLRLIHQRNLPVDHRSKFMAAAAGVMRRVLVDYARAKKTRKRGGGIEREQLEIDRLEIQNDVDQLDILAVHEALNQLAEAHDRAARVVELRFFSGMCNDQIAQELSVSTKTVQNDWVFAKAWLYRNMSCDQQEATDLDSGVQESS